MTTGKVWMGVRGGRNYKFSKTSVSRTVVEVGSTSQTLFVRSKIIMSTNQKNWTRRGVIIPPNVEGGCLECLCMMVFYFSFFYL